MTHHPVNDWIAIELAHPMNYRVTKVILSTGGSAFKPLPEFLGHDIVDLVQESVAILNILKEFHHITHGGRLFVPQGYESSSQAIRNSRGQPALISCF